MPYRVIDLCYSPKRGAIDDEPLQRLLHGHEVVQISERFYRHDGVPHLVVGVRYRLAPAVVPPKQRERTETSREANGASTSNDWKDVLEDGKEKLFETLRSWRTARARADAVPPYVVLTNVQLAEVANRKPATRSGLKEVPGLGNGRLERFGDELLGVLSSGVVPQDMKPSQDRREKTKA